MTVHRSDTIVEHGKHGCNPLKQHAQEGELTEDPVEAVDAAVAVLEGLWSIIMIYPNSPSDSLPQLSSG